MLNDDELKADLQHYLQVARDVLLWKLDGLSEYDCRRPLTPTATNLLGLVKHLATIELGYFGLVFDRPFDGQVAWFRPDLPDDALEANADMWATPDESREHIVDVYRRAWAHSDATIRALPLEATGSVVVAGRAPNLPPDNQAWWDRYRDQVRARSPGSQPDLRPSRKSQHTRDVGSLHHAHAEYLPDPIDTGQEGTDEGRQRAQLRIGDHQRLDQVHVAALRSNVAVTCREDVLQPIDLRSIGERKHVIVAAPEGVDWIPVRSARAAPNVTQDREPRQPAGEQQSDRVDESVDEPPRAPQPRCGSHSR